MKNAIIIPCYNEATRLKLEAYQEFIDNTSDYLLCFANDGSSDNTLDILNQFRQGQSDRVLILDLPENVGKAEAVRTAANVLLSMHHIETVGYMDADLATGFDDYQMLVDVMESGEKQMVFGSRKACSQTEIERSPFRKLASQAVGLLTRKIISLDVKDTQCGAKVFSRSVAEVAFRAPFQSRWLFDIEIFIRVKNHLGKQNVMNSIQEVALNAWEEVEGSKITFKDSIKFPINLIMIAINYNIKPEVLQLTQMVKSQSQALLRPLLVSTSKI